VLESAGRSFDLSRLGMSRGRLCTSRSWSRRSRIRGVADIGLDFSLIRGF
jgi:hypothetical protein